MMRDDKLIELFEFYAKGLGFKLVDVQYDQIVLLTQEAQPFSPVTRTQAIAHVRWMATQAIEMLKEAQALEASAPKLVIKDSHSYVCDVPAAAHSKREKAHRGLGFIQATLWLCGVYTLNELKEHSHKCSDDYEETKK